MATKIWLGNDSTTPYDWSVAANWSPSGVPVSTDEVYIPAGSEKITAGLNQSAVTLSSLVIQEGYDQNIGASAGYLQIGISGEFRVAAAGGIQYIDIGASAISPIIESTGGASIGTRAFNLIGSAISVLDVQSGSVGIASDAAKSATVTTARVLNGDIWLGENATVTTLYMVGGSALQQCSTTTTEIHDGNLETVGTGTIATLNVYGGNATLKSTGTVTTLNLYAGNVDLIQSSSARTITTIDIKANNNCTILFDPEFITNTTFTKPADRAYRVMFQGA